MPIFTLFVRLNSSWTYEHKFDAPFKAKINHKTTCCPEDDSSDEHKGRRRMDYDYYALILDKCTMLWMTRVRWESKKGNHPFLPSVCHTFTCLLWHLCESSEKVFGLACIVWGIAWGQEALFTGWHYTTADMQHVWLYGWYTAHLVLQLECKSPDY